MYPKLILTEDQEVHIKNVSLTTRQVEEITGISQGMVSKFRMKMGIETNHKKFTKQIILTPEQEELIRDLSLSGVQVAKITGFNSSYVNQKRARWDLSYKDANNLSKTGEIEFTDEQKELIQNPKYTLKELAKKLGNSPTTISKERKKLGVVKQNKPKPEKETFVTKEKEVYAKTKLQANMSNYELAYLNRKESKEAARKFYMSDADKIKAGTHKWVERLDRGIKCKVLTKI